MSKGYKLADGSLSTDYNIGDKFMIINKPIGLYMEGIEKLTYSDDDGSRCPLFESGGYKRYFYWEDLKYVKEDRGYEVTSEVTLELEKEQYIIVSALMSGASALDVLQNLQDRVNTKMLEGVRP